MKIVAIVISIIFILTIAYSQRGWKLQEELLGISVKPSVKEGKKIFVISQGSEHLLTENAKIVFSMDIIATNGGGGGISVSAKIDNENVVIKQESDIGGYKSKEYIVNISQLPISGLDNRIPMFIDGIQVK
jgi:hypothetical protein